MNVSPSSQIATFRSLFKGREDVFAVRWEKGNKSGYMPAYFYDPYRLRVHKMVGHFRISPKSLI
ncbi:TOTE conflict system archaeo-eukaryotic primase domain-containing protein [Maribacter stanieri]|uniref:TOTE conflict system archaeo-eukaryotic primase domain-containing protein n=1 Tax=Maribacter stanieri TaxID=440514 RepID=UPI003C6D9865|tara:strand:+ start:10698 stop:10889 length:192 start_codon:yes stop_codon:yes gene_type:complete